MCHSVTFLVFKTKLLIESIVVVTSEPWKFTFFKKLVYIERACSSSVGACPHEPNKQLKKYHKGMFSDQSHSYQHVADIIIHPLKLSNITSRIFKKGRRGLQTRWSLSKQGINSVKRKIMVSIRGAEQQKTLDKTLQIINAIKTFGIHLNDQYTLIASRVLQKYFASNKSLNE